ncbi:MAG: Asp-tRNA(Asn)/Glu-tRNA(Gln) amidotransferase subunit GatB [Candidatus Colwellbacteria bacterium]|jgi:aspartyl-tRNA(Asn)/glutamyl-tRNA(Gln) amidotransferase subunit B|nr:Asp-tRNA(Asn)/Glu-tRNA(Gln) amidotransferase subunit GatB [Candidatus Colwellbacteria bacterium]
MKYIPTIGLEVHMELNTATKMFCRCPNDREEKKPNINVCPICLGHPGTMPAPNKEAIKSILKLGMALGGNISERSYFDRKSYFYPDLPKGYQISQYEYPFVEGGELTGIKLTRIHLEEDAGKLVHSENGETFCDYNRAGVPLMELVTEPDIENGEQAVRFTKELQLVLRYLGISSADMEKGEMRLEANISVRPEETDKLGTKVEVKNLNSFKFMAEAIDYEIKRQIEEIEKGNRIIQETRGWDSEKHKTFSQRSKEEAHDYRYLPEPDIPPFDLTDKEFIDIEKLRLEVPEMPWEKRERFVSEFSITDDAASTFSEDRMFADYYEQTASEVVAEDISDDQKKECLKIAANYMIADVRGVINQAGVDLERFKEKVTPENMADLCILITRGDLSSRMAKDILAEMYETGLDPRNIIKNKGIKQVTDESAITEVINQVLEENPKAVEDYKNGKENVIQFLFGQTMAKLKGQGNPEAIRKVLGESLK